MVWSDPPYVEDGQEWRASDYNRYIRDNLMMLAPALATTAGLPLISVGEHQLGFGDTGYDSDTGTLFDSTTASWTSLGVSVDVYCRKQMAVHFAAHLVRAYVGFKVYSSRETVLSLQHRRAIVHGLSNTHPQRYTYYLDVPEPGEYTVKLYGSKNTEASASGNGRVHNARLFVVGL